MNRLQEVVAGLGALRRALPLARRRQLRWMVVLMVFAAFSEMMSLAILVPFLGMLSGSYGGKKTSAISDFLVTSLGVSEGGVMIVITGLFLIVVIIATGVRVVLNVVLARVNFRTGHEIGSSIHSQALYQPYLFHVQHNTAEIVAGVIKVDVAVQVMQAVLVGISSSFISICIILTLLFVSPTLALVAVAVFGGAYVLISRLNHPRLLANGRTINFAMPKRQQVMNESLGGVRDVILDQAQEYHKRRFDSVDSDLRLAQESNQILMPLPRYLIEGIAMVVLAVACCWVSLKGEGVAAALPILGVLLLGAQRLLPMLQQAYQGWAMISGHLAVIQYLAKLIQPVAATQAPVDIVRMPFNKDIRFVDVAFSFASGAPEVFRNVNLVIPKGCRVGIVGPTGGGKSTLLNLLMGLLEPSRGEIFVDDVLITGDRLKGWQRNIAHVPQSIFLADASIMENVAFSVPYEQINAERVQEALRQAQLSSFIASLPDGIKTFVGENGVRLSGGQRQRLGIARALYKQATVLILDEATSALDEQTEVDLVRSVEALGRDITLIMIAHRLSTLRGCDFLLRVERNCVFPDQLAIDTSNRYSKPIEHEPQ